MIEKVPPVIVSALILAFCAAVPLNAQDDDSDDEVYELSPFTISAEDNNGYRATSTLAGTRLKTNLKDLGSAISVVTPEFLEDTGATDVGTLFVHTSNTEVGGSFGNYSGVGVDNNGRPNTLNSRRNPQGNSRIRGLSAPNFTRDYFSSDIPIDSYNLSRVTINRGPNSLLFGIGSPAGVVNNGLNQASLGSDFGKIRFRFGKNDSHRIVFDYNKKLIEGRLALRVSALNEETFLNQDPAFDKDQRFYGAFKAILLKNENSQFLGETKLRGSYEVGSNHSLPPDPVPPVNGMQSFFEAPPTNRLEFTGEDWNDLLPGLFQGGDYIPKQVTDVTNFTEKANPWLHSEHFFQQLAITSASNDGTSGLGLGTLDGFQGRIPFNVATDGRDRQEFVNTRNYYEFITGFAQIVLQDRNVFDYRNSLFAGSNDRVEKDFDAWNTTLEQSFLGGNAGIELAYDEQSMNDWSRLDFANSRFKNVYIDTSNVILDQQPNPNLGRPMVLAQGFNGSQIAYTDRETFRGTAYYRLDFDDVNESLGKWLGNHNVTALFNEQSINTTNETYDFFWATDGIDARNDIFKGRQVSFKPQVVAMAYVGSSLFDANSVGDVRLEQINLPLLRDGDEYEMGYFDLSDREFKTGNFRVEEILRGGGAGLREIDSEAISLQSYWLEDHLITVAGWRTDEISTFERVGSARFSNGAWDPANNQVQGTPISVESGNTFTWSAVGRVPEKYFSDFAGGSELQFHYSESENFTAGGARRNVFNEVLSNPRGETKEYGFSLYFLDGDWSARFNWFETNNSQVNTTGINVQQPYNLPGPFWLTRIQDPLDAGVDFDELPQSQFYDSYDEVFQALIDTVPEPTRSAINVRREGNVWISDGIQNVAATRDFSSEGFELEVTGNPTSNWRISFNLSQQETVINNTAKTVSELADIVASNLMTANLWEIDDAPPQGNVTYQRRWGEQVLNGLVTETSKDGTVSQEQREWRWNLTTNYNFSEGLLKGFGVGGSVRWQDEVATGYQTFINPDGLVLPDLSRPFLGPSELHGDLWFNFEKKLSEKVNWKIQLNLQNVLGDDEEIPTFINPDGQVAVIRNPAENRWFITNTFTF